MVSTIGVSAEKSVGPVIENSNLSLTPPPDSKTLNEDRMPNNLLLSPSTLGEKFEKKQSKSI